MFSILQQQANRIARGNPDLSQDILSMSYDSYQRAQKRGKNLSIGDLVNLMKYRAGSLRSGERLPFGNISNKTTHDVFHKGNFFNGNVEILSLDYDDENPGDGRGIYNSTIATQDFTDAVLFNIQFKQFLDHQSPVNRRVLQMRYEGYTLAEIAKEVGLHATSVGERLKRMEGDFLVYFELRRGGL
jgi:hypothetical protein